MRMCAEVSEVWSNADLYLIPIDADLILRFRFICGWSENLPRGDIKLRAMPWTSNGRSVKVSFSEWSTLVSTIVANSVEVAIDSK
ncbi:hypothetical protein A4G99_16500 [Haladaptatus sp. R4]|nr:hypothetical protein A4G99_16500 [Haladaptatus sp. R4]